MGVCVLGDLRESVRREYPKVFQRGAAHIVLVELFARAPVTHSQNHSEGLRCRRTYAGPVCELDMLVVH